MTIRERVIRGGYISRADCLEHAGELERAYSVYGRAMAAMEAWERELERCTCEWDGGYGDDGSQMRRCYTSGCPVHEEDE
jgi:hypothetical protein